MSAATRAWLAFPAIGAGLIHLSIALSAPVPVAIVVGLFGAVEFFWGVLTFARETVFAPRVALVVGPLPTIGWAASLASGVSLGVPVLSMIGACVLELVVVVTLARHSRTRADTRPARSRFGVAAAVVTVLVIIGAAFAAASVPVNLPTPPPSHGH